MSFEQLKELSQVLTQIDALQEQINALKTKHPDAYARIMENWAIESTYNSNNIEGSTLSLGETALVYNGVEIDASVQDIAQAEGGFAALRFLRKELEAAVSFSADLIKHAHEIVFAEAVDPLTRGAYRKTEVEITGTDFEPVPAAYIPERMESLVSSISKSKKHAVINSALFHLEFECIHPFVNANGRTGRLMSNYLLMSAGYEPINIHAESRARYILALQSYSMNEDPFPFASYFCTCLCERLKKIESMLNSSKSVKLSCNKKAKSNIASYLSGEDI